MIEEEQSTPDGNFPTVEIANPEDETAFNYGLALAEKQTHN